MCSDSTLTSLRQLKTKFMWDHHEIGEKIYSNGSGILYFNFICPWGAGAFSGDFTTNLARQCRAFSRALKFEKLKAPLFRGPKGAGATNDWCITQHERTGEDNMCLVVRKPVFGVSDHVRHKPGCTTTEYV